MVEVGKAEKQLHVTECLWLLPILDSGNLTSVHLQALGRDIHTRESHFLDMELVFSDVLLEASFLQLFQDLGDVGLVFFEGFAVDQNVAQVCSAKLVKELE